jgi:hypothetical protein
MPAYDLPAEELNALVAFIHTQMDHFANLGGGRRSVQRDDLRTGNAAAGKVYFKGDWQVRGVHPPTGDLVGMAGKYQGLALLQQMLYPAGNPAPQPPKATVTLGSGEKIVAPLASEDEFSVTLLVHREAGNNTGETQ